MPKQCPTIAYGRSAQDRSRARLPIDELRRAKASTVFRFEKVEAAACYSPRGTLSADWGSKFNVN